MAMLGAQRKVKELRQSRDEMDTPTLMKMRSG